MAVKSNRRTESASRRRNRWQIPCLESLEQRVLLATIIDLGTLSGDDYSIANDINNSGQVVGDSMNGAVSHAFLYSDGAMIGLGSFPGANSSEASGINSSGQVVGYSGSFAFLYSNGAMTDLGTVPGATNSVATDINDSGEVVGLSSSQGEPAHAFLYRNGAMTDLNALIGDDYSNATGINNSGQVVGFSATYSSGFLSLEDAFLYSGGAISDLATLPDAIDIKAHAINNSGQVVGYVTASDHTDHAFLYSGGAMTDLGFLPGATDSTAGGINDFGQVVGESGSASTGDYHAFLYSEEMGMVDLNSFLPAHSGWVLTRATAINNNGQIVGVGDGPNGSHAFLLDLPPVVPLGLAWNAKADEIDYSYKIALDPPQPTTVNLYWATGTTADTILDPDNPVDTFQITADTPNALGMHSLLIASATLGTPPATPDDPSVAAGYLLAVTESGGTTEITPWKNELSGLAWLQANGVMQCPDQGTYPFSTDLARLNPTFQRDVQQFKALKRHSRRSQTQISNIPLSRRTGTRIALLDALRLPHCPEHEQGLGGTKKPPKQPAPKPPTIIWDYGDPELSQAAANQMLDFFGHPQTPAWPGNHFRGKAIDLAVTWNGVLMIRRSQEQQIRHPGHDQHGATKCRQPRTRSRGNKLWALPHTERQIAALGGMPRWQLLRGDAHQRGLRGPRRPTTTQDSFLAAGPALPGGMHTRRDSMKGF